VSRGWFLINIFSDPPEVMGREGGGSDMHERWVGKLRIGVILVFFIFNFLFCL
jgi:hypothetical protein